MITRRVLSRRYNNSRKSNTKRIFKRSFTRNKKIAKGTTKFAVGGVLLSSMFFGLFGSSNQAKKSDDVFENDMYEKVPFDDFPIVEGIITMAPDVPPPITRKHHARVRVNMDAYPVVRTIDGVNDFEFWTFNGGVPGPMLRARVGDVLELSFTNKDDSGMQHNVDFHAVTGPGGGATLSTSDFGETRFVHMKLLRPGLYIYHCAVSPVSYHIGNGMYGMILVDPKEGLPPVDKEFYVVQGDFYTEESDKSNFLNGSYDKVLAEDASYVLFNGKVGALTDEGKLKVKQGDRIRIYFGNGGPNLVSSFHIIGMIFDKVYREGDLVSPPARHIQTTLVPAGGTTVVEVDAIVPGTFTLVDHSIARIEKGAVGFIEVEGKDKREDVFSSPHEPKVCADCKLHP